MSFERYSFVIISHHHHHHHSHHHRHHRHQYFGFRAKAVWSPLAVREGIWGSHSLFPIKGSNHPQPTNRSANLSHWVLIVVILGLENGASTFNMCCCCWTPFFSGKEKVCSFFAGDKLLVMSSAAIFASWNMRRIFFAEIAIQEKSYFKSLHGRN